MAPLNKPQKPLSNYLKYTSMAFEMIGALALGYLIGRWIDCQWSVPKSLGTIASMMIFLFATLFRILYSLTKS